MSIATGVHMWSRSDPGDSKVLVTA